MNERTQELAAEAKEYAKGFNLQHEVFERKFAELIVKECALQCLADYDMDLILEHFGVEE
jgi:hypothetical protein